MSPQFWGCYAVSDHLQPNACVADVLLFDRLVIPVPPEDDPEALRPWEEDWRQDEQRELLGILGGIAYPVPWTSQFRAQFQDQWSAGLATGLDAAAEEESRSFGGVSARAAAATRSIIGETLAQMVIGQPDVHALAVYADPLNFDREWYFSRDVPFLKSRLSAVAGQPDFEVDPSAPVEPADQYGLAKLLIADFAIPGTPGRSGPDLLREAVDLASEPEMVTWRRDYHGWIADMGPRGLSEKTLVREMREHIAAYNAAARRKKRTLIASRSATVFSTAAGMSTAILGGILLGVAAALPFAFIGDVIANRGPAIFPEDSIKAGALLAEAAKALAD
jgi:hypothetical protein